MKGLFAGCILATFQYGQKTFAIITESIKKMYSDLKGKKKKSPLNCSFALAE